MIDGLIKSITTIILNSTDFLFNSVEDGEFQRVDKSVNNIFPSPTFWNHHTLNTSLYKWKYQLEKSQKYHSNILHSFIFGKINFSDIEYYLCLLHMSKVDRLDPNVIQIEDVIYNFHEYSHCKKNYSLGITSSRSNLHKVTSNFDKLICAKYLILIMNEVYFEELNMYNYTLLVYWVSKNLEKIGYDRLGEYYPKGWNV